LPRSPGCSLPAAPPAGCSPARPGPGRPDCSAATRGRLSASWRLVFPTSWPRACSRRDDADANVSSPALNRRAAVRQSLRRSRAGLFRRRRHGESHDRAVAPARQFRHRALDRIGLKGQSAKRPGYSAKIRRHGHRPVYLGASFAVLRFEPHTTRPPSNNETAAAMSPRSDRIAPTSIADRILSLCRCRARRAPLPLGAVAAPSATFSGTAIFRIRPAIPRWRTDAEESKLIRNYNVGH
jgi:hypothetical protein